MCVRLFHELFLQLGCANRTDKLPVKERQLYFSEIGEQVVLLVITLGVSNAMQQFQPGILSLASPFMGNIRGVLTFVVFVSAARIWLCWTKYGITRVAYRKGYNRALNDLYTKQSL